MKRGVALCSVGSIHGEREHWNSCKLVASDESSIGVVLTGVWRQLPSSDSCGPSLCRKNQQRRFFFWNQNKARKERTGWKVRRKKRKKTEIRSTEFFGERKRATAVRSSPPPFLKGWPVFIVVLVAVASYSRLFGAGSHEVMTGARGAVRLLSLFLVVVSVSVVVSRWAAMATDRNE